MRLPAAAVLRHLLHHPAQLVLALAGLAVGVATIAAVDMATASAARAFELSIDAVNGAATHEIVAGPAGIDELLYVALRRAALPIEFAPVVEGYVAIGELDHATHRHRPLRESRLSPTTKQRHGLVRRELCRSCALVRQPRVARY